MSKEFEAKATLSHYRIVAKLGAGGMGEVYLAEDTLLDRKVALKLLPAEFTEDEDRVYRFVQEAKAASALNHPNIITIYEIGEIDGTHFIATEFIDGQTLRQQMTSGEMTLHAALDIAIQTASALTAAHEAGIVHRDIKPENVMLRRDGIIKVLDFGLAKLTEQQPAEVNVDAPTAAKIETDPGTVMGTASYMSPEQARGQKLDARTDIFSLSVVLYEMIASRSPFEGVNAFEVIGAILNREPQPLKTHRPELPDELERIISKALRKDREQRYQHIKDLQLDLADLRRELEFEERLKVKQMQPAAKGVETKSGEQTATAPVAVLTTGSATPHLTTSSAEYLVGEIKRHKPGMVLAVGLLLIAVAAGTYFLSSFSRQTGPITSLAILPFINASGNAEVEYLSDGMTETLISSLSQLPNLNVKARSSVFRYKGREMNLQKIAQELKVQAILTGRVVERGEQLTLSLELVDTRTENAIWSEQYNRKQTDLVALQSEIARDVSSKLRAKLSGTDQAKVTKNYTANPEAYQLYLKSRFYWNKRTVDGLKQAVEYYKQAIERDPAFALAYSGLAETYVLFPVYSVASPKESMPLAKAAALKALEIDETIAEAHAALGLYLSNYAWNQAAAEKELRRAIELKPNYPTAHHWLGNGPLLTMQRFDEAVAAGRRAEELDPLSVIISADTGYTLLFARRYDEVMAQCQRTLTLDPNFYYTHYLLGWAYYGKGMYREAIAAYRKSLELNPDPYAKALLALALAKSGGLAEAIKLRDELVSESTRRYLPGYHIAIANMALGERDEALARLEKDLTERGPQCSSLSFDPILDDLRNDPRFADLVRRVALAKMD
jgi:serine/threonine protein kinase/Tfp pilus assembly protein PilF